MNNGYLIINGFDRKVYQFKYPLHVHEVWNRLIDGYPTLGLRDAEISTALLNDALKEIEEKRE